jgi:hypothetical protein
LAPWGAQATTIVQYSFALPRFVSMWRRRATGIGEHCGGCLTYRLLCYSWHYAAHSSRFPALPVERQMGIAATSRPGPALPRYSLTSGGVAPQLRPTWIPLVPSTVQGPSCDHLGPASARSWHPGANADPQSRRVWYQVLYILHRTLAARFSP